MATDIVVSAVHFLIGHERPTTVYRPNRPPKDRKFCKNWLTMAEIRGKKNKVGAQKARVATLIQKLRNQDDGSDVSLIYHLRVRAMIVNLFGLNSHFSEFLDEDILAHPGWQLLNDLSRPVADKFTQSLSAPSESAGDALFDQADEMFGRLRHALWFADSTSS